MKAVFVTGGKQYAVCEGDVVYIEKLNAQADETVTFEEVLFVGEGAEAKFGTPVVEGASVDAKVLAQGKNKKVIVFKYKPKKGEKCKKGHRQAFTKVQIEKINA